MTTWDAEKYEQWFGTPRGIFAARLERELMESMTAAWLRRGKTLLEVGCGTGMFLHLLWGMGFDVTGVDASPVMLKGARQRLGEGAELHLANGEHLPFDDKEFDYGVLWSVLEFCDDPMAVLSETVRVSGDGLLIGFLNRYSLYYLSVGRNPLRTLGRAHWFSWPEMRAMLTRVCGRSPSMVRTVLSGPVWSWRQGAFWHRLNGRLRLPCFGAFTAVRVDFQDSKPLTPLMAWKREPGIGSAG